MAIQNMTNQEIGMNNLKVAYAQRILQQDLIGQDVYSEPTIDNFNEKSPDISRLQQKKAYQGKDKRNGGFDERKSLDATNMKKASS